MMGWFLSCLPRKWFTDALLYQWRRTLPRSERIRLDYWGATGNPEHHPFQWADKLEKTSA